MPARYFKRRGWRAETRGEAGKKKERAKEVDIIFEHSEIQWSRGRELHFLRQRRPKDRNRIRISLKETCSEFDKIALKVAKETF